MSTVSYSKYLDLKHQAEQYIAKCELFGLQGMYISMDDVNCEIAGLIQLPDIVNDEFKIPKFITNLQMSWEARDIQKLKISGGDNLIVLDDGISSLARLTDLDLSELKTSKITKARYLFNRNYKLAKLDLSKFNTSNLEIAHCMFNSCVALKHLDLSNFDTRKLKFASGMFEGCCSLETLDISSWELPNLVDDRWMFKGCFGLKNLRIKRETFSRLIEPIKELKSYGNVSFDIID